VLPPGSHPLKFHRSRKRPLPNVVFGKPYNLRKSHPAMPDSVIHSTLSRHCGMEIQGENHTPARSLLYSIRIGYAAHSRRKAASRYRQAVASSRLLSILSADLSGKIRTAARRTSSIRSGCILRNSPQRYSPMLVWCLRISFTVARRLSFKKTMMMDRA